jgi:phospholipid/cholesterol/gamma-HCH transport system substrate-binding protein
MAERDDAPTRDEDDSEPPVAPPSRGRDQAVWVGFFLVVGIIAIFAALFILTDAAFFRGRYIVSTVVTDAGGIRRGDPVQMRGVNIGRVQRFKIAKDNVEIRLELEGEYKVPKDSHVELKSGGLLGGTIAEIVPGDSNEYLRNGDHIDGRMVPGLFDAANRVAGQVEKVMAQVEKLMTDTTVKNIAATAENAQVASRDMRRLIADVSTAVAEQRKTLATLEASLQRSATGLEKVANGPELDRALKRLDTLGERMDTVTASLQRSSQSVETVTARAAKGEGSLGKLMTDDELYRRLNETVNNMNQATLSLNRLVDDIQKNPKKYINLKVF